MRLFIRATSAKSPISDAATLRRIFLPEQQVNASVSTKKLQFPRRGPNYPEPESQMRTWKKVTLIVVLAFLEMVFLSWGLASNLPHRRSEVDAFTRYESAPTQENKQLWNKERERTESEVRLRATLGVCLAVGNLFLIGWVARRPPVSPTGG